MHLRDRLTGTHRLRRLQLEAERVRQAGAAMRIAPLPEAQVHPGRRPLLSRPDLVAPTPDVAEDQVVDSLEADEPDGQDGQDGQEGQEGISADNGGEQQADGWDNVVDLLRSVRLPRHGPDEHASECEQQGCSPERAEIVDQA